MENEKSSKTRNPAELSKKRGGAPDKRSAVRRKELIEKVCDNLSRKNSLMQIYAAHQVDVSGLPINQQSAVYLLRDAISPAEIVPLIVAVDDKTAEILKELKTNVLKSDE